MRAPGGFLNALNSSLLAFVLAILVWVVATNNELNRVTYPSTLPERGLPIELVNMSPGLVVTEGLNQRVLAEILVPREREEDLAPTDLIAHVDLAGYGPGTHQIEVLVERQPFAPPFRLLSWKPDRIVIQLDEVVTRTMEIEVAVEDSETVPATYRVLTPSLEIPTMTIVGPAAVVAQIERVVAEVSVENARSTVTMEVKPVLMGAQGRMDSANLQMTPERVNATVPIEQRQGFRELIVRALIQGTPAPGYWVSSVNVEPKLVTIKGQPSAVNALDGIVDTVPVNVEGLEEGEFIRNVALELDESVSPLTDGFVQVRIKIEPQTSSKTVTLTPTLIGLQPGLVVTATGISPSTVDVLLKGPIIELEDLSLDEVIVILDLTTLGAGTHLVEPRITPPNSLRAESVIPEQVEVTIIEQRGSRELLLPVTVLGMADDQVAVVEPLSVTVGLEGPLLLLDALDPARLQVSVSAGDLAEGSYFLTPTLAISDRISVTTILPPQVTLKLFAEDRLLVLATPIQLLNLDAGLRAITSSDIAIVRVAGPGNATTLSRDPAFGIVLDLAGLGEGQHLREPQIRLPPGYTLVSAVPRQVEVRLLPITR